MSTVTAFATAVVGLALWYDGEATADVELNDSGVWVTKTSTGQLGRFNSESQAIDGVLLAGSASFDVQQDAGRVLLDDDGTGTASPVEVAHLTLDGQVRLPAGAQVASGGATTAILDDEEGLLWVVPFDGATAFDPEETDPVAEIDGGGALTVSRDGTVLVAAPSTGTLWRVGTHRGGAPAGEPTTSSLPVSPGADVAVTAVGDEPVVLDRSGGRLVLPDGTSVPLDAADGAALQQPSAASDHVVVATASGLVAQPLDGGDATTRTARGVPAAPVQLDDCTYGAWSSTGQVIRDCAGTDRDVDRTLEGLDPQARLGYRVNRHVVVLNDLAAGTVWMAADEYQKVDDWDVQLPEEAEGEESDAELTNPEQVDQLIADRSQPNKPPQPKDDMLGVRPGRSTILPVLANDVDPDGDVMTATVSGDGPEGVQVERILGGAALQAVVPQDADGTAGFEYEVSDGRGGTATASVSLTVSPWGENEAPEQTGDPVLKVAQGSTAEIKVLPFFKDPDGDDLFLASADATAAGDDVRSRPDGTVEFRDGGTSTGRKVVSLSVADGQGGLAEGTLLVDVVAGEQPPIAVNDHVVVPAGQTTTVEPLRNDSDPNGDELRLTSVSEHEKALVTPNTDAGTFAFAADEPGSYDLTYQVTDGPGLTTGLVRVDVLAADAATGPPIVVTDTALLPAGGTTLVDVLANDTDPAGGVLVVQSVSVPDDAGVSVAVLAHQMLRITELRALDGPVTVEYTVSNGTATSVGQVRVVSVPAPTKLQPPNAAPDEVTVHAGDVVTVPVLRNDTHPDGLELFVQPELEQGVDGELGEAFVSEDTVRFRAGSQAGTAYAIYRVRDTNGQEDSAQVTIRIRDGQDNAPPVPRDVEARVLSGGSVRVDVPLDGIDPDGDSVQVTGVASAPGKGTARVVDGSLEYTAARTATGLDTFTYAVLDARGETATGTVRVGISRPGETNQAPVAVDDEVTVRGGRTVAVAALVNDTDPDGDQIALVPSAVEESQGMDPQVVGDRVVITSPPDDGSYTFYYGIQDTYGARATGAITVQVAADAPLLPPVARDDAVQVEDILGTTEVTVPVLDNDDDPDGAASELTVTSDAPTATVTEGGDLVVTLTEQRQVVTYTATDMDGLTAKAFVKVPGLTDQAPTLRPGTSLEVVAGDTLDIDIKDHVLVVEGRTPRITTQESVKATEGSREVTSVTTVTYTPSADYHGPASVSFEVTDGSGPDDPDGNTALLTIPVTVLPPENLPPELRTATLDVAAGEEASVDLARFATDPDGDPLTFTAGDAAQGVTTSVEGGTLRAQASPDVPKGTVVQVPVTVSDDNTPPVTTEATLTVVASTRPLARANDDAVDDAHQGKETVVPVLANDSDPFPETGLTVLSAVVETGQGGAAVTGDSVAVTPRDDFVGVMVVRYRVQDATKDPDREVEGRVHLTVLGKPEAPTTPQVVEVRSETVVLTWDPPNNNGAEITGYTVRSQNGYEKACGTTTCTLDGLTNDVEYTFTVFATNDVGDGPASPPSEIARPDEKPDPPAAPTLEFGDQSLTVTWTNATYTDRSAIECVNLRISPAPPNGATDKTCLTSTTTTWEGLTNGQAYTVQVQAENRAPDPSDWGEASAAETPAGKPAAPTAPTARRTSIGDTSQMEVTWAAPDSNGAPITRYTLEVLRGGSSVRTQTVDGGATSATVGVTADTTGYAFRVRAHNKATDKLGEAEFSPASNAVRAFATPSAVSGLSARATGANGQVELSFGDATGNGVRASEITYQYNVGGGWTALGGNRRVGGLTNGQQATIRVRAVAGVDGASEPGPASSATATPYGPIPAPDVTMKGGDQAITYSWSTSGNGRPYDVRVTGAVSSTSKNGSGTLSVGHEQTRRICVRVVPTEGDAKETCREATSDKKPEPVLRTYKGSNNQSATCTHSSCAIVDLSITGAAPNTSFSASCWTSHNGDHMFEGTRTYSVARDGTPLRTDGNGNFPRKAMWCHYGQPGAQVWIRTSAFGDSQRITWG
ncbi:Ig-like domain-containing protein [Cellulosimicrobium marinum]|uniref:Ig-like domain-containing protein n=1 Tax=Cellulosimicrobium marinum TaxID=1638992 RepID=UPI001E60D315|nr:Ig-like domain-containing protein [Cellulosimicrobium marinum]MCB7137080.1 Ig-like domain-containing protein [Cellulosimicrobium marinum]